MAASRRQCSEESGGIDREVALLIPNGRYDNADGSAFNALPTSQDPLSQKGVHASGPDSAFESHMNLSE